MHQFNFSFILLLAILCTSCTQIDINKKDNYIAEYETFVKEVRVLHENFTDQEWEECRARYNYFSIEEKKVHAKHFTESDIQKINSLEDEYATYLIVENFDDFMNSIGDVIEKGVVEFGNLLEETGKELENMLNEELDTVQ